MATNVTSYVEAISKGRAVVRFLGAAGVGAAEDGCWMDVRSMEQKVLHIKGITDATVQLYGSNKDTQPANADDETQIGSDYTSDSMVEIGYPYRWMKVKVSAWVSGTITGNMVAKIGA